MGGWAAPGPQAPARLTLGKGREAEPGRWPVQGDPSRLSRPGPGARPHLSGLLTTACRSLKRRPWFITALPQALRPLPAPAPRRGPWGWLGWQLQGLWTAVNHHRLKAWGPAHAERGTPHPELLSGGVMALPAPRQLPFPWKGPSPGPERTTRDMALQGHTEPRAPPAPRRSLPAPQDSVSLVSV